MKNRSLKIISFFFLASPVHLLSCQRVSVPKSYVAESSKVQPEKNLPNSASPRNVILQSKVPTPAHLLTASESDLVRALQSPEQNLRIVAARRLKEFPNESVVSALVDAIAREHEHHPIPVVKDRPPSRKVPGQNFVLCGNDQYFTAQRARDQDIFRVRTTLIESLASMGKPGRDAVLAGFQEKNILLRGVYIRSFADAATKSGDSRLLPQLEQILSHGEILPVNTVLMHWIKNPDPKALKAMLNLFDRGREDNLLSQALQNQPSENHLAIVAHLVPAAHTGSWRRRSEIFGLLGNLKRTEGIDALTSGLGDKDSRVREAAANGLAKINDPRIIPPLILTLKAAEPAIRIRAVWGLKGFSQREDVSFALKSALISEEHKGVRNALTAALR